MEAIKTFLKYFLQAEATASDALIKPNLEAYNQKLETMYNFFVPELQNKFRIVHRTKLWDEDFYEDCKDAPAENSIHIYKVSQCQDEKYNKLFYEDIDKTDALCKAGKFTKNRTILFKFTY